MFRRHPVIFPKIVKDQPIPGQGGRMVFTNASAGDSEQFKGREHLSKGIRECGINFHRVLCEVARLGAWG